MTVEKETRYKNISNKKDIIILVATHKKYQMPNNEIYMPIHVGKAGKDDLGYRGDDTGDNISDKNDSWSELTGLYWGWKNLNCTYLGLVQYRRHFMYRRKGNRFKSILNDREVEKILRNIDIILPKARNYHIDTLEEHFRGYDFVIPEDLINFKRVINDICPEYIAAMETVMARKTGHMCNMFIMKKELLNKFCAWEFAVLEEFERYISKDRKRIVGYMAEHMLDIWIEKNGLRYTECNVIHLDWKNEIDRRIDFIMRKLGVKFRRIHLMG